MIQLGVEWLLSVPVLLVKKHAHESACILIVLLSVVVSFDPISYTVTEGDDDTAILRLVRSGDLSTQTVVTVNPTPGSALGIDLLLQGLTNSTTVSHLQLHQTSHLIQLL